MELHFPPLLLLLLLSALASREDLGATVKDTRSRYMSLPHLKECKCPSLPTRENALLTNAAQQ
jgi:hypothetical protein